ncbi:MAG: hypothetical protein M0Q12_05600 [Synergistaceae bacterium]|jgi:hypothetical protein|nr:hypothetical protein [Synergistaceae bacterium]
MIKSRIEKIEGRINIVDDPFDTITNAELVELTRKVQFFLYTKMKDKETAREYKELFIEEPDILELLNPATERSPEALVILGKQKTWELEHEKSPIIKEEISDYYENSIKAYKSFNSI